MQIDRRQFLQLSAASLSLACLPAARAAPAPLPVILATDIGDDIDGIFEEFNG